MLLHVWWYYIYDMILSIEWQQYHTSVSFQFIISGKKMQLKHNKLKSKAQTTEIKSVNAQ